MSVFSDFFGYDVPWWLWAFPATATLLTVFIFVSRTFGVRSAIIAAFAVGTSLLVALSYRRGKQHGWQERIKREKEYADHIAKRARAARDRSLTADPSRLRDDDGFKRRD
ncbi:hypothetical protein [Ochrobactrum sp. BTU2]|uniref:hypothetical protein n=1 Tax=Ochrobactrum sp. BTU2 TaxID=2856166 RepID=UPI00211A94FF|nr:hypothetical protein [Ochrobactrum sp. BTU2]MCQ9146067.1 hypothetical protein [Ochrobactrum sp. BTU2]